MTGLSVAVFISFLLVYINFIAVKGKEAFRQYIIIKAERSKRNEYVHYLDQFRRKLMSRRSQVNVTIDVDPNSMI